MPLESELLKREGREGRQGTPRRTKTGKLRPQRTRRAQRRAKGTSCCQRLSPLHSSVPLCVLCDSWLSPLPLQSFAPLGGLCDLRGSVVLCRHVTRTPHGE